MPPHQLTLKPNIVVMLLWNLQAEPRQGLRNQIRILIKVLGSYMIECEVLTESRKRTVTVVFLPCITHKLCDSDFPFTVIRNQFLIRPCFSITIKKSPGQTLEMESLYLRKPAFIPGQLYVSFSHVCHKTAIVVCLSDDDDNQKGCTSNIAYLSIL